MISQQLQTPKQRLVSLDFFRGLSVAAQGYLYQIIPNFFTPYFSLINASLAGAVTYVLILLIPL